MAGDWIKMRGNLWDDPRVSRLCDITDQGEAAIIGGLYWLWSTADQHTVDGVMPGLTLRQIDRKTGVPGLAKALCEIGWIEVEAGQVTSVHRLDRQGLDLFKVGVSCLRPPSREWAVTRTSIFKRDNYTCRYCGERGKKLECDHVIPVSRGGLHTANNLVTACFTCNRSKSSKLISEWSGHGR